MRATTLRYQGWAYDEVGNKVWLDEDTYEIVDTIEPDPSVGIFGEPAAIIDHPDYPEGLSINESDHQEYLR